jgi:hypothetical protein
MDKELVDAKYNELRDEITKYGIGMAENCRIHREQTVTLAKIMGRSTEDIVFDLNETNRAALAGIIQKMAELCLVVEKQAVRIASLEDKLREGM